MEETACVYQTDLESRREKREGEREREREREENDR
jgi:hypothetical protein